MITLLGEPKSTNNIYRYACRGNYPCMYMTKDGRELKESYKWEAKSQWKAKPIKGPLDLYIKLFFKIKRNHDIDNYNKLVLDALTGIVYEDDGQIQGMYIEKGYDKANPRVEVIAQAL